MSNFFLKSLFSLILAVLLTTAYLFIPQSFFSFDNKVRDVMFNIRGEIPHTDSIVIVDIDEKSLNEFGQWPWPRTVIADLIEKLTQSDAGIIGLDIVFAGADKTSPHTIASKLDINSSRLENYDLILADTIASTPTVGGYVFTIDEKTEKKAPLIPAVFIQKGIYKNSLLEANGIVLNEDILQDKFYSSGFFNIIPDDDGLLRRAPILMSYDGMVYPSLVFELIRIYGNVSKVEVIGDEVGIHDIKFGSYDIPVDNFGRLLINYRGGKRHFKYISALDIINGSFKHEDVASKFVLVGTSAIGLYDLRSTPFDSAMPGVEVHANILDNMLQGDYLNEPNNLILYDILIIWVIIFLLMLLFSYTNYVLYLPIAILMIFLLFEFFYFLLFDYGVVINLLFPLVAFFGVLIVSVFIDYFLESRQKEQLKNMFAKKVSKSVMQDLMVNSKKDLLDVHDKEVAIFFSDIRGFTSITERMESSQQIVALLNRYMTPMVDEISSNEGTVDKFIGDSIMAYWNAPNDVENYAQKAVSSSIKQFKLLENLNKELEEEFGVRLKIGVAIHVGEVTVGEMGSLGRSDYTIIGDNVNLASRLESLNTYYNTSFIVSKDTYERLTTPYRYRSLDIVRVKGKSKAVEIYEIVLSDRLDIDNELDTYHYALRLYRDGSIEEALEMFQTLLSFYSHTVYDIYLKRCEAYLKYPDKPFDVIHTM